MPRSKTRKYKNRMRKGRKTKRGGEGSNKPTGIVATRVKALQGEFTKKKSFIKRFEGPENKGNLELLAEKRKTLRKQKSSTGKKSSLLTRPALVEKPPYPLSAVSVGKTSRALPASTRASPLSALPSPASPPRASPTHTSPTHASPPRVASLKKLPALPAPVSPLRASQETGAPRKLTRGRVNPDPVLPEYADAVEEAVVNLDLFLNGFNLSNESATNINNEIVKEVKNVEAQLPLAVQADFKKMVVVANREVKQVIKNSPNKDTKKKNKEYIIQIWYRTFKEFIKNKLKRKAKSGNKTVKKAPVRGLDSRGSIIENPIRSESSESNRTVKELAEQVVKTATFDDLGNILNQYGVETSDEFKSELNEIKKKQVKVQNEINSLVEENQQNERKLLIEALRSYIKEKVDKLQREGEYILLQPEEPGNLGESYKKSIKKPKLNEKKFIQELNTAYEIYLNELEAERNSGYLEILPK